MQLTPEFIAKLQTLAKRKTWNENDGFNAYDYSGGNYDRAYWGGTDDGETVLARQMLKALNIPY